MKFGKIKSTKIRIGDISISYRIKKGTSDNTPTLLFLHGFPFNKNMWHSQLELLSDEYTAIAVDFRGHGNSTTGHGFFSIDVFAKDLLVFIKKLKLTNVCVCGISMGGYVALRAYEIQNDAFQGLILCDTHCFADSKEAKQKRFDTIQAVLKHGKRPFSIGFIQKLFTKEGEETQPEAVKMIKSSIRRNSVSTICSTLLALASRTDTSDVLSQITIPTLLVRGKEDKITPKEDMDYMHEKIKDSQFVEIEQSGHLPHLEQPEEFSQVIHEYLEKHF
ncbi:MAG TPA: alpha/beta hydrolase [Candidatus Sphingobacterium stercoripullorum]|uniref:Alpha/beta hydrolase n=1 Tax=Candidatus Sphingobacterium stercoripullorum TaxID=2838759 RepID=A0A9D2AZ70_9SPHI|nr:alpha/beta hydrolase [Candidatus Sphingobacterium stercoripullorum]